MGRDEEPHSLWANGTCDERRGAGQKSVEHEGNATLRGAQFKPYQCSDLEAPERGKDADGIPRVEGPSSKCVGDDHNLSLAHRFADARSVTDHLFWRYASHRARHRCSGSSVSNADLSRP
jgi:hypothetical protein